MSAPSDRMREAMARRAQQTKADEPTRPLADRVKDLEERQQAERRSDAVKRAQRSRQRAARRRYGP